MHIRWMIRRDTPEVMAIELGANIKPWTEEELLANLRKRNCIGMVIEEGEKVVGFMVYELHKGHLNLLNIAVGHAWRGKGYGRKMLEKLESKLSGHRRTSIYVDVSEHDMLRQQFLKAIGWRATRVDRRNGPNGEDTYCFVHRVSSEEKVVASRIV